MTNVRLSALGATTLLTFLLSACGGSGSNPSDGGVDSQTTDSHLGPPDTGKPHDAGKIEETGAHDTGGKESGHPVDKTPITGLKADKWTWVPFSGALCRDGSSTGIGVNLGTSKNLMIFLEGGGACFNFQTCSQNESSFHESDFQTLTTSNWRSYQVNVGVFDRTNAQNPVQDWSYVYVPYCTGDVHAGNNVSAVPDVPGMQHFVGAANIALYLDRVVPTFSDSKQVLLAGMSAGGFGTAVNYGQVAEAFGKTPVTMLDDSGPFMEDPFLAACLQNQIRTLWGLDKTVIAACGADCSKPASVFLDYVDHVATKYPNVGFGLADSTDDNTITVFFGFGASHCTSYVQETQTTFTGGLLDIRKKLASQKNYGEFIFTGADHTSIQSDQFYTRTAGGAGGGVGEAGTEGGVADGGAGVLMTDWVKGLLAGAPTNAGP
jgi:hypothetical protein